MGLRKIDPLALPGDEPVRTREQAEASVRAKRAAAFPSPPTSPPPLLRTEPPWDVPSAVAQVAEAGAAAAEEARKAEASKERVEEASRLARNKRLEEVVHDMRPRERIALRRAVATQAKG